MVNKVSKRSARHIAIMTALFLPLGILLWLHRGAIWAFVGFVRDRQAVTAFLDRIGFVGPLVLMGLIGLQVLIPSLPAEPPMIAGAYVYGFTAGFLMSWITSVAVSQGVFYLARYAGRPLAERFVPARLLDKWTRTAGEKGTMFFTLAFIIPPVPSDVLIYVAGMSEIEGRRFFVANFFGRMPMIVLLALVGAYGFRITPATIVGITVIGVFMLLAWWYYVRERPDAQVSTIQSQAGRAERDEGSSLIEPCLPPSRSPVLSSQHRLERQDVVTIPARLRPAH